MDYFIGALTASISGFLGFLASYYIFKEQIEENLKERIRNRKTEAMKKCIDSLVDLLSIIRQMSELNSYVRKMSDNKYDFSFLLQQPTYWETLKEKEPYIVQQIQKYFEVLAETWKAYAYLRISCRKELSVEMRDFTNYLLTLVKDDIYSKWEEMMGKANQLTDKLRQELEET